MTRNLLLPLVFIFVAALSTLEAQARSRTRMFDPLMDTVADGMTEVASELARFSWSTFRADFLPNPNPLSAVSENYFEQKLNPSNPTDLRTFKQRYYVYSGYASGPSAPVVLYIGGEAPLVPRSFMGGRFADQVAQKLHAHLVGIEHRYYGDSQPFAMLTPENLQYLSSDNALMDLASIQKFLMTAKGLQGKWIAMGGSYPGALSAFYRLKYPELIAGSLASSAPVQAKNAFEEYDSHVTEVLGPVCSDALRKVVTAAESALAVGGADALAFKDRFSAASVKNDGDFLYLLADVTADAVQYGYPAKLCDQLVPALNPVQAYADYVRSFLKQREQTADDFSPAVAGRLGADESDGMRQWTYQSCREFGYWQDGHHDRARSVRSANLNADYDRGLCKRFFGLNSIADEAATNAKYYQPLLDPAQTSRILFTNGSVDPWSELSITHQRGNDVNANTFSAMIDGKAHCSDLYGPNSDDPLSLTRARQQFLDVAAQWVQ
ncbi:S28 family serine protease [Bdellovibrionota bacterium FG-1]